MKHFLPSFPYIAGSNRSLKKSDSGWYKSIFKRVMDVTISIIILPVVMPLVLILVVLTRLDGGPGFYVQSRVGKNGNTFKCWKIRTMVDGADNILAGYLSENPQASEEWKRDQKLQHDPRITKVGAFMRRTSLDELPQIWNVLRGEMSLVGPRPFLPDQECIYSTGSGANAYYTVRPGISGLWQVSARNSISFKDRVGLDAEYVNTLSLLNDLKILFKTAAVVVNATGV